MAFEMNGNQKLENKEFCKNLTLKTCRSFKYQCCEECLMKRTISNFEREYTQNNQKFCEENCFNGAKCVINNNNKFIRCECKPGFSGIL